MQIRQELKYAPCQYQINPEFKIFTSTLSENVKGRLLFDLFRINKTLNNAIYER